MGVSGRGHKLWVSGRGTCGRVGGAVLIKIPIHQGLLQFCCCFVACSLRCLIGSEVRLDHYGRDSVEVGKEEVSHTPSGDPPLMLYISHNSSSRLPPSSAKSSLESSSLHQ